MPYVQCKVCCKEYYTKPSWLKIGHGIYCSVKCRGLADRKGRQVDCHMCGTTIYKPLQELKRSKSKKYFCSTKCSLSWINSSHFEENSVNWKGGRYCYKNIMKRKGEKYECKLCGKKDHRILAVHHIDKNRLNNDRENLAWLCYNCHFLVHHHEEEKNKFAAKL